LDTNSGTISRLTLDANGAWQKVDLVRGLPRSEENHANNGLQYDAATNKLYVAQGGNTNMGSPSALFAYLPEYAYSAAILSVDLTAIDKMTQKIDPESGQAYVYDLPTLDDPTRGGAGQLAETVFGGNDGLNMAKITADSPVQVYAPGFRNPYDLVLTQAGKLYALDNGGNLNWGDVPLVGPNGVTNQANPGSGFTTPDSLHLITKGYYGGHANPIRANGADAGLVDDFGKLLPADQLPIDFATVVAQENPIEGYFTRQDPSYKPVWTNPSSTNGLTEYTSDVYGGAFKGQLLAADFNNSMIKRLVLSADGSSVVEVETLKVAGVPLDITTRQSDGTIWIARYGTDNIWVLRPTSSPPPPPPPDDEDGDGLSNIVDRFGEDPNNGMSTIVRDGDTLTWSLRPADTPPGPSGMFALGFTGLMVNGVTPFDALYDTGNITPGGAAGVFSIDAASEGDATGAANTQENGFQFGVNTKAATGRLTVETKMEDPFGVSSGGAPPVDFQSAGMFMGTGDQDNYVKLVASANGGVGGFTVLFESAGEIKFQRTYDAPGLKNGQSGDFVRLFFDIDKASGIVVPRWVYTTGGGITQNSGSGDAIVLSGDILTALKGDYSVQGKATAMAVGMISTSAGPGSPFSASWDDFTVSASANDLSSIKVDAGQGIDATGADVDSFIVANQSPGKTISRISIDVSSSLFPDLIYDPKGQAGDVGGGPFKITSQVGTFTVASSLANGSDAAGWKVLNLDMSGFDPGEQFGFSIDVDPASIKGSTALGGPGSISGLELVGSKVTVTYDDGSQRMGELFSDGSQGGSSLVFADALAVSPEPTVAIAGVSGTTGSLTSNTASVTVSGPAGRTVRLLSVEGVYDATQPPDPFEANRATRVTTIDIPLGSSGTGTYNLDLTGGMGGSSGKIYTISAVLLDLNGAVVGKVSEPIRLEVQAPSAIMGTAGDDVITPTQTVPGQALPGDGADTIMGLSGNDSLNGGGGFDSLDGGDGNDTLLGGAGDDTLLGGEGNDQIVLSGTEGLGDRINAGLGTADTLKVLGTGALTLSSFDALASGIEVWSGNNKGVIGTGGANRFDLSGLSAVTGMPWLDAASGNDTVIGSAFADDLRGGAGADSLQGGLGNDTLTGGAGNDTVDGGSGTDTVAFTGLQANYSVTSRTAGGYLVQDLRTGTPDGTDVVLNAEFLRFSDATRALAVSNSAPGAVSDSNTADNTVAENAATGTLVGLTALASDPDAGDNLSYTLVNNAGGRFAINASTGVVSVADGALLDFETATSHVVKVRATDTGGLFSEQEFTISLTDVAEGTTTYTGTAGLTCSRPPARQTGGCQAWPGTTP
jgi:Ca2+-binding RTX toxin-like protein